MDPNLWSELGVEFFGAFLGFGFALLINSLTNKSRKKKTKINILDNLIDELNDIRKSLNNYVEENADLTSSIYTPTWNALQNSGMILELIDSSCYSDLINTYSSIYNTNEKTRNDKPIPVADVKVLSEKCANTLHKVSSERKKLCPEDSKGPTNLKK